MAAYTFSTDDGKTYKRRLHGFEAICNSYALYDFLLAFTGSVEVQLRNRFGTPIPEQKVIASLRSAWILLRHRVPAVALRTTYQPEEASWTVLYDVPNGSDDIDTWVARTLIHGEYPLRLIVSPMEVATGRYMISLAGPHGMIDGRMSMILLNDLVGSLNDQIYETAPVDSTIRWGEETARLASTGAILTGLDMDTIPEPVVRYLSKVPFLPPFVENIMGTHDVTMRLVVFDSARTSALREKCRGNHITVTVAVDAIFALAHAEAVLLNAAAIGEAHYASTIDAYTKAIHWFMPLSCKDQRPSWPTSSSIRHPEGTTLFGTDGYPLQTRMETIRKAVGFSVDTNSFNPCNKEFFWSVVAAEIAAAHAAPRKDLAAYVQREREKQAMCKSFHPSSMMVRSPISSSIGHLEGLGLFTKHTPGSSSLTQVHRVLFRARPLTPTMTNIFWQYDGKLNCSLLGAAKWNSPAEMDGMEKALRKWFDHVIE